MENENKIVVGLDIGTTKIACFIGQRSEAGKLDILGYGHTDSAGVERGVVKNIRLTASSITKAVREASDMANYEVSEVYVGIAGQHIKSMKNTGSIMIPSDHKYIKPEDVERLTAEQRNILLGPGEEIIHVFAQKYIVDGEELTIDPVGVTGHQLTAVFHIVTGNTANLRNISDSVELAGLKVRRVVLEPIASAAAVLDDTDRNAGVALVDIGGGTTDIALFHEGIIRHTSVLALAGNVISSDIQTNCHILKEQAEKLKVRFGSCLPETVNDDDIVSIPGIRRQAPREIGMRMLAQIIKARTTDILEQVNYEIEQSGYAKQLIAGIVLTGGGAKLQHIKELSEYVTRTDTRIGTPDEHLSKMPNDNVRHPMYATGIGLVLCGLDYEERANGSSDSEAEFKNGEGENKESEADEAAASRSEEYGGPSTVDQPTAAEADDEVTINIAQKKKSGRDWMNAINGYLNRVFRDDIDDEDD